MVGFTIFGIDSEVQIIGTSAAGKRNASGFLVFKMTDEIARRCPCHSRFLGGIKSFQNHGILYSIWEGDSDGGNFPEGSCLLNLNQWQIYSQLLLLFLLLLLLLKEQIIEM